MNRAVRFAPLALFVVIVIALIWRLATPTNTSVPSRLDGKPLPAFDLGPGVETKSALSARDLADGRPHILNIFASWCVPCVSEVKVLLELKSRGAVIDGIAIRDTHEDVAAFLARNGDPYDRIGSDPQSALQIALGSSGVPESFIIDGEGVIRYQHIGPIERSDIGMIEQKLDEAR